jgi:nitroimidazol reductase NimA-like FMN-containing flavoprotein (pyridoxamine 5'-phosphate oxidase superfamily)
LAVPGHLLRSQDGGMEREAVMPESTTALQVNECWALLRGSEVGRIALVTEAGPEIFPVNFVVDHGSIVFRTTDGTKLEAMSLDQRVAFEVDGGDRASGEARSVIVKGLGRLIDGAHELFDATGLPLYPWDVAPKHRFVRIEPQAITGRRFAVVARAHWGVDAPRRHAAEE